MIESPQGIDRGRFLFEKNPKTIQTYVTEKSDFFFTHEQAYLAFKNRYNEIDAVINLRFKANEAFIAEIALPIVRKMYKEIKAFTRKYFETDPIITLQPAFDTPYENCENMELALKLNFQTTRFRQDCLDWLVDESAKCGVFCCFSQYEEDFGGEGSSIAYNPNGVSPYASGQAQGRQNIVNYAIHPLNYFQDPLATYWRRSGYQGFIDAWLLSQFVLCGTKFGDMYIKENLEWVIENCKKGYKDAYWYGGGGDSERQDLTRAMVNVRRMWTTLHFSGNEDDSTKYYIEFVGDRVIRINENPVSRNLIPLTIGSFMKRADVWWGNTYAEEYIPHQHLSNFLVNAKVESTLKASDRMILVPRGKGIHPADINNRHQNSGIVFHDGIVDDPSRLMVPIQFADSSRADTDWLFREIKQSIQEGSPIVNMQNKYNEGGMNNNTLGAAQMIANIGEIIQTDMMSRFGYGIENIGYINAVMLQQVLGDVVALRASPKEAERFVPKFAMLGDFLHTAQSALKINEVQEFMKYSNIITQWLNWSATGHPAFQPGNVPAFIHKWLRAGIGQWGNLGQYYPEQINSPEFQTQTQPQQPQPMQAAA